MMMSPVMFSAPVMLPSGPITALPFTVPPMVMSPPLVSIVALPVNRTEPPPESFK